MMTWPEFIYIFQIISVCLGRCSSRCPTVSCHTPTDPQSGRWTRQDVSTSHTHTHTKVWEYQAALCVVRVSESVYRCEFQALGLVTSPRRPMRSLRGANTHTHTHTHTHTNSHTPHIMAPSCTLLSIVPVFTPLNPLTHTQRHTTGKAITDSWTSTCDWCCFNGQCDLDYTL